MPMRNMRSDTGSQYGQTAQSITADEDTGFGNWEQARPKNDEATGYTKAGSVTEPQYGRSTSREPEGRANSPDPRRKNQTGSRPKGGSIHNPTRELTKVGS